MIDGSDNFATRYLVSDACYFAKRPLVTGAVGTFDATLTTIRAHETRDDGTQNPTYRCLFPEPPPEGSIPACSEAGILGALPGILGSMMAMETIREIVGFGEGLTGRLLMIDSPRAALRDADLRLGSEQSAQRRERRRSRICRSINTHTLVIAGLDPAIHQLRRIRCFDGCAGQARA